MVSDHFSLFRMMKILFPLICILFYTAGYAQQLAFPGAEGFGAHSKGGRGGKVIFVENLNDSGPGSLRQAVEDREPRTIIFKVSGTIELQSKLSIENPYITIAGQTAPGDGICLKNYPLEVLNTHDVVIRGIRVRPGVASGLEGSMLDAIDIRNSKSVIIDHCTGSWSSDEILNTWHGAEDVTVQYCIFAEPLNKSVHDKGAHGYGASIGGKRASYHHNLFAHAVARNPSIGGNDREKTELLDFRNNVVFNWGHRSCDGKPLSINFVNNYYKPGPATNPEVRRRVVRIDNSGRYGFQSVWHIEGNMIEGYPGLSSDNWKGAVDFEQGVSEERNRQVEPFESGFYKTEDAKTAYENVLKSAGVIVPGRDEWEKRIIAEVRSGKPSNGAGIIDKVEQGGGWPVLKSSKPEPDSDRDGMPDTWEKRNGLNHKNPDDQNGDANSDGYTNLEEYLNQLMNR